MKLLIDTQAFIWFVENDKQLSLKIISILEDSKSDIERLINNLYKMGFEISKNLLENTCYTYKEKIC